MKYKQPSGKESFIIFHQGGRLSTGDYLK